MKPDTRAWALGVSEEMVSSENPAHWDVYKETGKGPDAG